MAILGFQLFNIGESGNVPQFIYLNTNNTIAQVTTTGYLSHLIQQGNEVKNADMALVVTKATPTSDPVPILCVISFPGGVPKLTQYGSVGGNFSPATNYTTLSADGPITGSWQHVGGFEVQAGVGNVTLQSDTGQVNILAPNAGQPINIIASLANIIGINTVSISSAVQIGINSSGTLALTSAGPGGVYINASAGPLTFVSLPNAATANQLFYDPITGVVTYGAAGGGGGFTWTSINGGPQTLVASNGYVSDNAALQTFTLPAVAALGDEYEIVGKGAGGWTIAQGAGQSIQVGNTASTVGAGGSVSSSNQFDVIKLVCTTANTGFSAEFLVGNLNIV